jgi:hypothetical protein
VATPPGVPRRDPLPLSMCVICPLCQRETDATLRRFECSNGAIQVRWQCGHCGTGIGSAVARDRLPCLLDELEPWDKSLVDARERTREEIAASRRQRAGAEFAQMREKYREYLSSPTWRSRRQAVLDRENGLCQGCRAAEAVEVHHLTYAHVKAELLFELVALCRSCHERIHGIEPPWMLDGE